MKPRIHLLRARIPLTLWLQLKTEAARESDRYGEKITVSDLARSALSAHVQLLRALAAAEEELKALEADSDLFTENPMT
jgi:hypothetical protein